MKSLLHLTATVVRLYLRDLLTVVLSLALIVFMMVLFGLVMGEEQFKVELPLAVVDLGGNEATARLLTRIEQDDLLVVRRVATEADLDEEIRRAQVIAGLVLPRGYAPAPPAGAAEPGFLVITSEQSTRWTELGLERLQRVVEDVNATSRLASWRTTTKPIQVVKNRYIDFIFPGVLAMAIMQACLASGVVLLQAKHIGVLRRLRLTPVSPLSLLGGFIGGRLLVVAVHLVVLVLVAVLGFDASILASWPELTLAVLLGAATFMALGVMLALVAPSFEAGNLLIQMVSLPMSFLCGVFFKLEAMPEFLAWVPRVLPLTYLVDVLRGQINLGLPLTQLRTEMIVLVGFLVVSLGVCAATFRFWDRES